MNKLVTVLIILTIAQEDTGPFLKSQIELFRKYGYGRLFRVGVEGSDEFSDQLAVSHRLQQVDSNDWGRINKFLLTLGQNKGQAVNFPTEKFSKPGYFIRHEFTFHLPSGDIKLLGSPAGTIITLREMPREKFWLFIGYEQPNETNDELKQSIWQLSWKTQDKESLVTEATLERSEGNQLFCAFADGKVSLTTMLRLDPAIKPDLIIEQFSQLMVRRIDPTPRPAIKPLIASS